MLYCTWRPSGVATGLHGQGTSERCFSIPDISANRCRGSQVTSCTTFKSEGPLLFNSFTYSHGQCYLFDEWCLDSSTVATAWLKTNLLLGSSVRITPAALAVTSSDPSSRKGDIVLGPRLSEGLWFTTTLFNGLFQDYMGKPAPER